VEPIDIQGYKALQLKNPTSSTMQVLPPFQIIRRFGFSTYIAFAMHLDIHYVLIHSKGNEPRKAKMSYNLERRE